MIEDKYIGLALAVGSTLMIGTSFVLMKMGLGHADEHPESAGGTYSYLKNPIWWAGMVTMILGEVANFAAYAFAPAILVTPLGALSVLIGAVLGSFLLKEELGTLGKLGCAICLIGAVVIVLHAPPDPELQTVDEILNLAIQPGFMLYCIFVAVFSVFMIYKVCPRYGKKNPLVFISICSAVGSISVMSVKAFGIALKLTFAGNNQFSHPSTYVFMIVTAVCILTQMNYFNLALKWFPASIVNPVYYVSFTTATLSASFILFGGFNTTNAVNTISLLAGFLTIFTGVYLLNLSRGDPDGRKILNQNGGRHSMDDGIGTDLISSIQTRRSMQARRSHGDRLSIGSNGAMFGNRDRADRDSLIRSYDEEEMYGLDDLAEESEDDAPLNGRRVNEKMNGKARVNGMGKLKIDSNRRASGLRSPGAGSRGGSRSPSGSGGRSPRSPRPL